MKNNVGLFLTKRAHLNPTLESYVDGDSDGRYTYPELNARSNRTANLLKNMEIVKGDRVALLLMNGVEFVESFFALAKIGAIVVPLNWRLVPAELSYILKDSGSTTLIFGSDFNDKAAELHAGGSESTMVENWLHVGDGAAVPDFARDYAELHAAAPEAEPEADASDDDLLYIMYTSGTTGLPKGAVHTHMTAIWACMTMAATSEIRFKDRTVVVLPLYHVGALTPMTGAVYGGHTFVVMRAFDPEATWRIAQKEKITTMLLVPAMLNFMLQVPGHEKYDISTVRWIMSGASPVPISLIEAYEKLGIEIHQVYGLTETCGPACLISPDDAMRKAGSTGKAFFHTDVRVVNSNGADVKPDEPGEVIIRGRHLMKEYWNQPEATAEAIVDGWLYSGDVATMDDEGFVYIQDRTKDMVISGGENVYPAEIENVILTHPDVVEVAVIGQPSEKWGESPLAVVVRRGETLSEGDVLLHCKGKLAPFKMPQGVEFIDEIPRNLTGKVLKRVLREQFPGPAPV
jgi:O-succinylbenzoate-CoA ligase